MKYFLPLLLVILFPIQATLADEAKQALYFNSCERYSDGEDFVRDAIRQCSKSRYERSCLKKARELYKYCPFKGSFSKNYSKLHSDALVVFVVASLKAGSQTSSE